MRTFWVVCLAMFRSFYLLYALTCLLSPLLVIAILVLGWQSIANPQQSTLACLSSVAFCLFVIVAAILPCMIYARKTKGDPNPWQSAFMSWFGSVRWYWNTTPDAMVKVGLPSGFLVENPMSYRLTAVDMRQILDKLQPGDILLRAYDGYLDGQFIRHSAKCARSGYRRGWFTHAALYVGEITAADKLKVPHPYRDDGKFIQTGPQMVLHSMAMGVHSEDILTWFRCDYLAVLRARPNPQKMHQTSYPDRSGHVSLPSEPEALRIKAALTAGDAINMDMVLTNVKESALEKVGEPYDFQCIISTSFNRFSCAEYVYYCYRSIHDALGLNAELHGFYPLGKLLRHFAIMRRDTVTPDDYYHLAKSGHLEMVWIDPRSKRDA